MRAVFVSGVVVAMGSVVVAAAQEAPVACERPQSAERRAAIAAAEALFQRSWTRIGAVATTAFVARPEAAPASPFQLKKTEPAPSPAPQIEIRGFVRAAAVACTASASPDGTVLVEFDGLDIRFHEPGTGWSAPLARGRLMAVSVDGGSGTPAAKERTDFATIILPNASLRAPAAAEIPPLTASARKR
jgi:hypothetical protein